VLPADLGPALHRDPVRSAMLRSNAEIADLIAVETGMRFKDRTVAERRIALGLQSPCVNGWSAPLTRARMISLGRR